MPSWVTACRHFISIFSINLHQKQHARAHLLNVYVTVYLFYLCNKVFVSSKCQRAVFVCTICHLICACVILILTRMILYHTWSPCYTLANKLRGKFSLPRLLSDSVRSANAAPCWAWRVVSPCLFILESGLPHPRSVVQTHSLAYYVHRQIQMGHSFWSGAGLVKNQEWVCLVSY